MNIFKRKTTWSNGQLWLFKLAVFSCGLLGGLYFKEPLTAYVGFLWIIAVIGIIVAAYLWINKLKR